MTSTPPEAPSSETPPPMGQPTGPRVTSDQVRDLSRLRRSVDDRKVAGVAGGLARHLDIDPVIVRVAFVVLSLFGGAGLIVYAACWILLPEEGEERAPLGLDDRSRSIALMLVGILGVAVIVGRWDWFWIPGPLILVALVAWLLLSRRGPDRRPAAPASYAPSYAAVPPTSSAGSETTAYAPAYAPAGAVSPEQRITPSAPVHPKATLPTYTPPPRPAAPQRPRNPRRRGPILFWFTLALITLGEGVLGILDLAGVDVPGSGYPALAVGLTAVMLLVGSVFGRAGGLILVGFLATIATVGGLASEKWSTDTVVTSPDSSSRVASTYGYDVGQYTLDLSQVVDPDNLDGRTIHVTADVGGVEIIVPRGMDVNATGHVNGPGDVDLFGNDSGGIDTTRVDSFDAGTGVPTLTIDVELEVGQITVRTIR